MGINPQFASPDAAAQASLQWGQAATTAQAAGEFAGGIGGLQRGLFQAQVAENNAKIERANAGATRAAGLYEGEVSKFKYGQLEGQQRAAQGASGIDVGVGSPVAVRESTERVSAMDAAMIHYNAARTAYGQDAQAANYKAQAGLDRLAGVGALVGGLSGVGATILGGESKLAAQRATYGTLFPQPGFAGGGS